VSSLKLVKRAVPNPFDDFTMPGLGLPGDQEQVAETGGVVFPNGRCIELIRENTGRLALLDSSDKNVAERIGHQGRTFVPPTVHSSILEVLTLPTGRASSGTTADIFSNICILFMEHSISEQTAKSLAYWALSTWFAELFPVAPYLVINGPRPEANLVLQLLTCVVRHGLPLGDISLTGLRCLPMHIQPTLLIGRVNPSMFRALSVSTYPRAYLPTREGLADFCCAKLPAISDLAQRKLAANFQPLLVDYKIRHVVRARDSDFDVPALRSEFRILARVLGSAIVDAPNLRADLINVLQEYQKEMHAGDSIDQQSIAIEAMLDYSHDEQTDQLVYVGQLAHTSTAILKARGSAEMFEPKALGWILRNSLGFAPKRDGKGFAIRLTEDVRRRIHQLAREFQVSAVNEAVPGCSQCAEMLTCDGEEGKVNSEPKQ
jgi:hypothetical protein